MLNSLVQNISSDGMLYVILGLISFLNVIVPVSGSATQTPLIAAITGDPHYAVTIATWLLMISCGMIAVVFRNDIRFDYFWKLFPMAIIGTVLGASLLIQLPGWFVLVLLLVLSIHFLYKKVRRLVVKGVHEEGAKAHHFVAPVISLFSSFLQGAGMSGSSLRSGFLYSENLKIEEVRGTAEALNFFIFAVASTVRFAVGELSVSDMYTWTVIFAPVLFIAIYLGRKVLLKLSERVKDGLIVFIMLYVVFELASKTLSVM